MPREQGGLAVALCVTCVPVVFGFCGGLLPVIVSCGVAARRASKPRQPAPFPPTSSHRLQRATTLTMWRKRCCSTSCGATCRGACHVPVARDHVPGQLPCVEPWSHLPPVTALCRRLLSRSLKTTQGSLFMCFYFPFFVRFSAPKYVHLTARSLACPLLAGWAAARPSSRGKTLPCHVSSPSSTGGCA